MKIALLPMLALAAVTGLAGSTGCHKVAVDDTNKTNNRVVSVDIRFATETKLERTTTQPATVHAYFETRVFAKVAGYLTDLKVDIGTKVEEGELLARIDVPEIDAQRKVKLATIVQMKANEDRATAQLAVSKASELSYQAKRDKTAAEVDKADARLTATGIELRRITDLVDKQALAERLQNEARKRHDIATAEKLAAEATVKSAEADLTLARAQSVAEVADLEVAKAATEVANRQLDELDELIKYSQILAPFEGVVTQRYAEPGNLVRNAQTGSGKDQVPLFVISQFKKVRVRVYVPERDVRLIDVEDAVTITLQALRDEIFTESISRVSDVLDEQTRTMMIEIDMDNSDGRLRPGMFGQARIALSTRDAITLPADHVHFDADGNGYVYVADASDKVKIVKIQTGLDDGEQIEITAGLSTTARVIGPLLHRLKDGQAVHIN
jgi:RND family efflux transporter MFP subunit